MDRSTPLKELGLVTALAMAWVALVVPGPLSLAYFWDEADVYVPGARWVAEHGLSVTPGVFPDDYSRGHPPLLYLCAAIVFRLFGTAPWIGHLLVLPFTAIAIVATYWLGRESFGRAAGAAAAILLASTPMVLSIGHMLLPELPLTALGALSLVAFARGRLGMAALAGVAAVWIKETGIFVAAGVGVGLLVWAWQRQRRPTVREIGLASLPLVALGAFFAWQRLCAGYFVFPHHQNLFAERAFTPSNLLTVAPSILLWHGRWVVLGFALLTGIATAKIQREAMKQARPQRPARGAIAAACLAPVLFNAAFFTQMFWLDRYALPAHPGLLVVACGVIAIAVERARPWLRAGAALPIAISVLLGVRGLWASTAPDSEEQTFAYADVIATHRAAFSALGRVEGVVLTSWPMTIELRNPYLGYVASAQETLPIDRVEDATVVGAILVSASSSRAGALRTFARERGLTLRATHRVGTAPALEIWR